MIDTLETLLHPVGYVRDTVLVGFQKSAASMTWVNEAIRATTMIVHRVVAVGLEYSM
jgi:hypothetical protein